MKCFTLDTVMSFRAQFFAPLSDAAFILDKERVVGEELYVGNAILRWRAP